MSSTIEIKKICERCGKEFIARKSSTRYCCKRCAEHAYKDKRREEHVRIQNELSERKGEMIKNPIRDFMTPRQCATFLAIGKSTVYRALASNQIPFIKIGGKTLISRKVIEAIAAATPDYVKKDKKAAEPITEFYTSKEVMEKFGIGNAWLYKMASKHNIPKTTSRGKTLWSKKHIDRIFGKPVEDEVNKEEWYTVDDVCAKFGMKKDALYRMVSELKITKQKVRNVVYYFRREIDAALGINPELAAEYYSMPEAMGAYGMTRDQISYYVRTYNVPRIYRDSRVYIERKSLDKVLESPKIE